MFGIAGVRMVSRLRIDTFRSILNQEIAWYDDEKNGVGSLCARLSGDASSVQGVSRFLIGIKFLLLKQNSLFTQNFRLLVLG